MFASTTGSSGEVRLLFTVERTGLVVPSRAAVFGLGTAYAIDGKPAIDAKLQTATGNLHSHATTHLTARRETFQAIDTILRYDIRLSTFRNFLPNTIDFHGKTRTLPLLPESLALLLLESIEFLDLHRRSIEFLAWQSCFGTIHSNDALLSLVLPFWRPPRALRRLSIAVFAALLFLLLLPYCFQPLDRRRGSTQPTQLASASYLAIERTSAKSGDLESFRAQDPGRQRSLRSVDRQDCDKKALSRSPACLRYALEWTRVQLGVSIRRILVKRVHLRPIRSSKNVLNTLKFACVCVLW